MHQKLITPSELKTTSTVGELIGRASVYDVIDSYGDRILRNAFTKTLRENNNRVVVLDQHNTEKPVGYAELTDRHDALWATIRLQMDLDDARQMYLRCKGGLINGISIGYSVPDGGDRLTRDGVREISEIRLWEVSLVTFPANAAARVVDVKAEEAAAAFEGFDLPTRARLLRMELNNQWRAQLKDLQALQHATATADHCVSALADSLPARLAKMEAQPGAQSLFGVVTHWDANTGSGAILGADGVTYAVPQSVVGVVGGGLIPPQPVEFVADGTVVTRVLRLLNETPKGARSFREPYLAAPAPPARLGLNLAAELRKGRTV